MKNVQQHYFVSLFGQISVYRVVNSTINTLKNLFQKQEGYEIKNNNKNKEERKRFSWKKILRQL